MFPWLTNLTIGYYTSHPPFNKESRIAIAAVGPTALAIQYGAVRTNAAIILESI